MSACLASLSRKGTARSDASYRSTATPFAVTALLERGFDLWDTLDSITRDEIVRLMLEIDGE